jgi:hypothetical protein
MMKLVVLALTIAAVSAAPSKFMETDVVVAETSLTQMQDSVADLKDQFSQLKAQAAAGMQVTPGVKKTVDRMVTMVENEIEPAIKEAHAADQSALNGLMDAVQTHNNEWDEKEALLQKDGDSVRDLIDDEQAKSAAWEKAADVFTTTQNHYLHTYDKQTDTCCKRDNAAVLDVEYVPAYAMCDYKDQDSSGDCFNVAHGDVMDRVTKPFTEGLALFRKLRASCKKLTAELAQADADTQSTFAACGSAKVAETDADALATSEEKRFQALWDESVAFYNGNYTALMKAYTDKESEVKVDEADRVSEWGAVQIIKCMLLAYKEGGQFDEATEKKCSAGIVVHGIVDIGYPAVVPQKVPVLEPFEPHTDDSAYENTCDARTPAPDFTCVVREPNPIPECSTPQAAAPAYVGAEGPWPGEKEGSGWSIISAAIQRHNAAARARKN